MHDILGEALSKENELGNKKVDVFARTLGLVVTFLYAGVRYFIGGDNFLSVFSGATGILFVWYAVIASCVLALYLGAHGALNVLLSCFYFVKPDFWQGFRRIIVLNGFLLATLYALHGGVERLNGQWHWESNHLIIAVVLFGIYFLFWLNRPSCPDKSRS